MGNVGKCQVESVFNWLVTMPFCLSTTELLEIFGNPKNSWFIRVHNADNRGISRTPSKLFPKIVNGFQPLTFLCKRFNLRFLARFWIHFWITRNVTIYWNHSFFVYGRALCNLYFSVIGSCHFFANFCEGFFN